MTAPAEIRSVTGEVATTLPGVTFGGTFPRLAALADRVAIVRIFTTGDGNHDIKPVVGRDTFGANLGSIYSRVAGANRPSNGMPTNVLLLPRAVDPRSQARHDELRPLQLDRQPRHRAMPRSIRASAAICKTTCGCRCRWPAWRIAGCCSSGSTRPASALAEPGAGEGIDRVREQALDTILGGVAEAFDLAKEIPRVVARYDTAPLVRPENIDRRWHNYNNYVDNASTLGKLLLLARRLCERGCGFVTVTTNFVWDMHSDVNNAPVGEGMGYMGLPLDHALSAFLEDVAVRGLSEHILLVVCGEMGRTPRINSNGGRDHWGNLAPLLVAGGGLRMGQVIGRSSRNGGEPATTPVRIPNLIATILHTLFDVGQLRLVPGLPRDIAQAMTSWAPIPTLVG